MNDHLIDADQDLVESEKRIHSLQLDFEENSFEDLEEIQKQAKAPNKATTIRNALAVYRWFLEEQNNRNEILVRTNDGRVEKIKFEF